jgi:hypothetical protein
VLNLRDASISRHGREMSQKGGKRTRFQNHGKIRRRPEADEQRVLPNVHSAQIALKNVA